MQDCIITNKGLELIAQSVAGAGQIVFTSVKTSSHQYTQHELKGLQTLADVKQTVAISGVERVSDKTLKVAAIVANTGLNESYDVKAIAVYAKKTGGEEVLFSVAAENEAPKHMPAHGGEGRPPSSIVYHLYINVENATQISVTVAPGAAAAAEDLSAHKSASITSDDGVHGLRYKSNKLQILGPSSVWENVENKVKIQDFSIDTTGWEEYTSPDNDYKKKKSIPIEGITADDIPVLNYDLASRNAAQDANASHVESEAGQIVVYAEKVPSKALTGTLVIERGER